MAKPAKEPLSLLVGRDRHNHWIVVETHGLCGGIFADQAAALRYAREESGGHPEAIRIVPYLLAFTMMRQPNGAKGARAR
jgi:hypothetical protein